MSGPNPHQLQRARNLRQAQTLFEQQLWLQLRDRRFAQFKFRRQHPIGPYIADFICFQPRIVIELDGSQHANHHDHDLIRDQWLQSQGFRVLRIWNNQWIKEREAVLEMVWNALHSG